MRLIIIIIIIHFLDGCQGKLNSKENLSRGKVLQPFVEKFISNLSSGTDTERIVTINYYNIEDTLVFNISKACPELGIFTFKGYSMLNGYVLCFLGNDFPSTYCNIEYENIIPEVVATKNIEFQKTSHFKISDEDIQVWTFYFSKGNLVKCFPDSLCKPIK